MFSLDDVHLLALSGDRLLQVIRVVESYLVFTIVMTKGFRGELKDQEKRKDPKKIQKINSLATGTTVSNIK